MMKWIWLAVGLTLACSSDDAENTADAAPEADASAPEDGASAPAPPLALTPDLCDDPSKLAALGNLAQGMDQASFGQTNSEQVQRMLAAPTEGPFYMFNLIRYRDRAVYPDGRETELTGREADALYSPVEFLSAIGARPVFIGEVGEVLIGGAGAWDRVAIVEYPCPLAFFAMTAHPEFQARAIHKEAGVEATIVMVTQLQPSPLPDDFVVPETPYPATADDPAFEMIHVVKYRDQAQYGPDADEPARTGREAMDLYSNGATEAAARIGVFPSAWFTVDGVFIGDGRPWDEVRLNYMPSRAGFDALVMDPTRQDGQYHREAALEDTYSLVTYPQISELSGGGADPDQGPPPVADDGTGTICQSDDDCPGDGVEHCLGDGAGGFCTRQGCGAGECAAPYLCCRGCDDAVAAFLPFEGSACLPGSATGQLTAAPANCTCD